MKEKAVKARVRENRRRRKRLRADTQRASCLREVQGTDRVKLTTLSPRSQKGLLISTQGS